MEQKKFAYALFNYIGEIKLPVSVARQCSHSGDCTNNLIECLKLPYVKMQLNKIDKDKLRLELKEYGAWDNEELANHKENLQRILAIASDKITDR